jgi:hypothetical protein
VSRQKPDTATTSRVDAALRFLLAQVGKPYFYGAEGPDEWDCSGLYRQTLAGANLWPMPGDATAAGMWKESGSRHGFFVRVPWAERQALDAVVYGSPAKGGKPEAVSHLVVVVDRVHLVGANGGGAPWHFGTSSQEPAAAYRARMALRGAKVKETPDTYWSSARVGVIRPQALAGVDLTAYAFPR